MDTTLRITKQEKGEVYEEILPQIRSLLSGEQDFIANMANVASVLKYAFPGRISWVGFYLLRGNELVLGPFQGKPACVRIQMGKGVCGTSALQRSTVIVPDVDAYPGHIACDPDSRSEIVVPMIRNGILLGVLDVDSAGLNTFDTVDEKYLVRTVEELLKASAMPS